MLRRITERTGHNGAIYGLIKAGSTPAGAFLSYGGDGWLVDWSREDPELGQLRAQVAGGQLFAAVAIAEQNALVAGALDGGLHWLHPANQERNLHLRHHRKGIYALARVGEHLFAAGGDGILSKWSLATGRVVESLPLAGAALRCLCYDVVRNLLFVGSSDQRIYALDPTSLRVIYDWVAHENSVFCLVRSPDGTHLLSGGRDAHLRRWLLREGLPPTADLALPAHNFTLNALAFSPNGEWLLTASRDKTIKLWSAADLQLLKVGEGIRDRGHVNSVNALLWLDERHFLSAGDDRRILEWEVG